MASDIKRDDGKRIDGKHIDDKRIDDKRIDDKRIDDKRSATHAVLSDEELTRADDEELVETGTLDPDSIHTPGIFVQRIVLNANPEKRIEQRTIRKG